MTCRLSGAACWLLLLTTAASAMAQTAAPSVDDILNHYIRALGGKAAIQKLTSRLGKGTITIVGAGIEGTVQSWLMYPNKLLVVIELSGVGTLRQGFDGTLGWTEEPQGGLRVVTGAELADLRRTAVFDRALRMKDVYPGLTLKDRETLDGKDVYVLETALDPWTYRIYFDVNSGLITRFEMEQPLDSGGKSTVVLAPDDYRPVAGVLVPFTLSESSPSVSWVERFTEITPNAPIDDAMFARPPQATTPK
ncbi:MAG: hypothetical protein ABSH47_00315 [Bryobacteraceae bacterium]|jgi:outer membrane lipoprotein-sorting protein